MLASAVALAEVFEGAMLVCFGLAWPIDILRTLRTRSVAGKSPLFMSVILVGYLAGLVAKVIRGAAAGTWPELVTVLYAFNAALVAADIGLCFRYHRRHVAAGAR